MRTYVCGMFAILTLASGTSYGVEGCCVEPDIAAAFMKNSYLSRELPRDFLAIDVPESFELIGSHQWFTRRQTIVAWRTDDSTATANDAIREVLEREGWRFLVTAGV